MPTTAPEKISQVDIRYKTRVILQSMRNGHSKVNPIKVAILNITQAYNSAVNDFPKESNNVEESNNAKTVLPEEAYTSEVSGKETQHDEKSGTCEGINWGSSIQENNLKIPHVPARASTHARRVLPS